MDPSAPAPRRKRRRRLFVLVALLVGALLALVGGELGVRVAGVVSEPRRHFSPGIMASDPELGWRLLPDYQGVRREYRFEVATTTNSLGYRGPEWDAQRAAAPVRVLCLGDSCTFGIGVGDEATYPAQLEELLRARGIRAAVFNSGVPGYDTRQERVVFERLVDVVRPTVVVVGWLPNDLSEPSDFVRENVRFIDGHMIHDVEKYKAWRRRVDHQGLYSSALYRFVRTRGKTLQESLFGGRKKRRPAAPDHDLSYSTEPLGVICDLAQERGARVVVLTIPSEEQVAGDGEIGVHQAVAEFARGRGCEVVDLASAWRGKPREGRFLERDRLHFTPSGSREVAEAVAAAAAFAPE